MPDLAAKIDGKYVSLGKCEWVFREPCGCPFGVMDAASPIGGVIAADEDAAWREFYTAAHERHADRNRGVTVELMTHERYGVEVYPLMRGGFTHVCGQSSAVA